jgi:hypothetical protein
MAEKFGLWLAKAALTITGNRELAEHVPVLPIARQRRFAIFSSLTDKSVPQEGVLLGESGHWSSWCPENRK